ncbi:MAG: helix-turn-helix transcriptional regulator [Desulfovibrio sp.]|nr:helix-turn-helix transcriptional regulator [Desulfovibrio sp.]
MSLDFFDYHNEMMHTNAEYKEAYEALEPEFAIARTLIKACSEAGMSLSDVAERIGITQPAVARIEADERL